ncbi:hypothetical protein FB567DRAFT_620354 [Paraphoma chrysanthemicola]|uniref:Uncharacterized protein n=1 Tax=Paraphoma chrysanthemicola TaxID=798071 RepID=A0A8K0R8N1_9PLEO|nr:hypothetical protein FB567DRAFT_620354 [Paraphoma chrysanthemicola]
MNNQNTPDETSPVVSDSDPVEIPLLLRIPAADGSPNYHDIYELPQEVLHEIARKCEAEGMCVEGDKTRYINYRKLNRNPEKYTPDKFGETTYSKMSVDADPNKLLKYLRQQSGGERDSSLKNLSREKLVEALKASLQSLEQQQAVKEHGISRMEPAHAAVSIAQPIQIKTEDSVMCELEEKRERRRKRKTEPLPTLNTNANKRYRTRSKTTAAVIESDFKSLPEKKLYQVVIKKEADEDGPNDDMNEQFSDEDTAGAVKHEA